MGNRICISQDCREWRVNGHLHRDGGLPAVEYADGYKAWYVNGQLHRDNDLPAVEYANGNKYWYVNGRHHRDDGLPAGVGVNGTKEWYVNGQRHRDNDLPAVERANGDREWYVNGRLHRDGGLPAVERANGDREWWFNGRRCQKPYSIPSSPIAIRQFMLDQMTVKGSDCPICLEPMNANVFMLKCNHLLHGTCHQQYKEKFNGCPICRD